MLSGRSKNLPAAAHRVCNLISSLGLSPGGIQPVYNMELSLLPNPGSQNTDWLYF
jgi:hypothetical protein